MNWVITFYVAILFFILTPGVLVSFPSKSGKFTVAAAHALVFALIWHFTYKFALLTSMNMYATEGFSEGAKPRGCPDGKRMNTKTTKCECPPGTYWKNTKCVPK